ncbi:MAG: hypothetical protein L3I99_08290 [Sulfurimonas sp.]|nr:hypothetical protein [Sulfurimonas sp.]
MQVSLDIKDDVYKKLVNAGVDMQSKFNEYLTSLVTSKDDYMSSKQFQDDKAYFHEALREVESGEVELIEQEDYDKDMSTFMKSL